MILALDTLLKLYYILRSSSSSINYFHYKALKSLQVGPSALRDNLSLTWISSGAKQGNYLTAR